MSYKSIPAPTLCTIEEARSWCSDAARRFRAKGFYTKVFLALCSHDLSSIQFNPSLKVYFTKEHPWDYLEFKFDASGCIEYKLCLNFWRTMSALESSEVDAVEGEEQTSAIIFPYEVQCLNPLYSLRLFVPRFLNEPAVEVFLPAIL